MSDASEPTYERTESEPQKDLNLNESTYYQNLWQSERKTARISPIRINHEKLHTVTQLKRLNYGTRKL